MERFIQREIDFHAAKSIGRLKVAKLMEVVRDHPYLDKIKKSFNYDEFVDDYIIVGNIDVLYTYIVSIKRNYRYFNINVNSKDVYFTKHKESVKDIKDNQPLIFNFLEYTDSDGEIKSDLNAYALYESKNKFFEDFSMSKYANMLFDNQLGDLAELNLKYFRELSKIKSEFNKSRRYRIIENNNQKFVRGITSDKYQEYGVDFTFVVSMLMLHKHMKRNTGNNYHISFAALSESKLEIIITANQSKDAGDFGLIRSAISVSTNDLGTGALNFTNLIKLDVKGDGIYLYPKTKEIAKKNISINHIKRPITALSELVEVQDFYSYVDLFVEELKNVKSIRHPDELRSRILNKIIHPNSVFKEVKTLKDVFKLHINNEISDFAKLLEMCRKAEELDIDYDLKDKLRYIVSDIIFNT